METYISSVLSQFYESHKSLANVEVEWDRERNVVAAYRWGHKIMYEHCPELEKVFSTLQPENEYAMIKHTNSGGVLVQEHWLYVRNGSVEERFEFTVRVEEDIECRRTNLSEHTQTFPSSIENIQQAFQQVMEEHPDYRLHVVTKSIKYYYV